MEFTILITLLTTRHVDAIVAALARAGYAVVANASDGELVTGDSRNFGYVLNVYVRPPSRVASGDDAVIVRNDVMSLLSKSGISYLSMVCAPKGVGASWTSGCLLKVCDKHDDCKADKILGRDCVRREIFAE